MLVERLQFLIHHRVDGIQVTDVVEQHPHQIAADAPPLVFGYNFEEGNERRENTVGNGGDESDDLLVGLVDGEYHVIGAVQYSQVRRRVGRVRPADEERPLELIEADSFETLRVLDHSIDASDSGDLAFVTIAT